MPDVNFNPNPNARSAREIPREAALGQRNVVLTELQSLVNEHVTFAFRIRSLRATIVNGKDDEARAKMREERCEAMSKYLSTIDDQIIELIQTESAELH